MALKPSSWVGGRESSFRWHLDGNAHFDSGDCLVTVRRYLAQRTDLHRSRNNKVRNRSPSESSPLLRLCPAERAGLLQGPAGRTHSQKTTPVTRSLLQIRLLLSLEDRLLLLQRVIIIIVATVIIMFENR